MQHLFMILLKGFLTVIYIYANINMPQHNGTDSIKIERYYNFRFFWDVPRYVQANPGTVTLYSKTRLLPFQFENIALYDHLTQAPSALKL